MAKLSTKVFPPSSGHSRSFRTTSSGGSNMSESMPNLSGHRRHRGGPIRFGGSSTSARVIGGIAESTPNLSNLANEVRMRKERRAAANERADDPTQQQQQPNHADIHLKMGMAHYERGDRDAATRCFRRVIAMHQERDDREERSGLIIGAPHPEVVRATKMLAEIAGITDAVVAGDEEKEDDDSDATPQRQSSSRHLRNVNYETYATGDVRAVSTLEGAPSPGPSTVATGREEKKVEGSEEERRTAEDDDEMTSLVSRVSMDIEGVFAPYLSPSCENTPVNLQPDDSAAADSEDSGAPADGGNSLESGVDESEILQQEFYASRDSDILKESFSSVSSASQSVSVVRGVTRTFIAQRRELIQGNEEAAGEDKGRTSPAVASDAADSPYEPQNDMQQQTPSRRRRQSTATGDDTGSVLSATTVDYTTTDGTFLTGEGTQYNGEGIAEFNESEERGEASVGGGAAVAASSKHLTLATDETLVGLSEVRSLVTDDPSDGNYLDEQSGPNELDSNGHDRLPRKSFNSLSVNLGSSGRSDESLDIVVHPADEASAEQENKEEKAGHNWPPATMTDSGASPKCVTHDISSGSNSPVSHQSPSSYYADVAEEIAMAASVASSRSRSAQGPSDETTSDAGENQREQASPSAIRTNFSPVDFSGRNGNGKEESRVDDAAFEGSSARTPTGEDTGESAGSNSSRSRVMRRDPALVATKSADNDNDNGNYDDNKSERDFLAFKLMARTQSAQKRRIAQQAQQKLQAHQESPRLVRGGLPIPPVLPPLAPFKPDPIPPVHGGGETDAEEHSRPKPRSILVRKESTQSVVSDMIESTATSWKERQSVSPSVSSKSRSVSWADQKKKGEGGGGVGAGAHTARQDDGDAVNIPPGQLMPEITFVTDQSPTVNLKAATATTQIMAQARRAAREGDGGGGCAAPPSAMMEEFDGNSDQMRRLSENRRRLQNIRASRALGDGAMNPPPASGVQTKVGASGDEATRQFQMGIAYYREQDYFNAKSCFLSCLRMRFEALGQDSVDVCLTQERLGDAMVRLGEVEEAHWQYLQALRGLQTRLGPQSEHVTRIMLSVGDLYFSSGCYGRALKYYEKSLRHRMELLGEDHRDVDESVRRAVRVHRALAHAASEKREHEMTLFHHREVLWLSRFASKRGGVTCNISVGTAAGGLGIKTIMDAVAFDNELGDSIDGEKDPEDVNFSYLEESRRLLNAKGGHSANEDVANVLGTIASIHQKKKELENARKCYMEKLDFLNAVLPENTADIADTLLSLGMVCSSAGKHRLAVDHLADSAKLFAQVEGKGSKKAATVLRLLCSSCLGAKDFSLALQHYNNYFDTCSMADRVEVLTVMGIIHCKRYDLRNAIDCFIEALKIESAQSGGETDNDLAPMIENLQGIFLSPKKFKHGTYYCYEKARDCEDMKIILQNLGLAQLKRRNTAEAGRYLQDLVANMNEDGRMEQVDFSFVLFCMGNVLFRRCQYRESKLYYEQCLHGEFQSVHTTDRVELLANLGTAYLKIGESEKSSSHFNRALQELEKGARGFGASASAIAFDDGMTMMNLVGVLNQIKSGAPNDSTNKEAFILRHLIALNLCKELRFDEAVSIFEELKRHKLSKATSDDHFSIIQVSVDKSNTYLMKGNMKTARLLYDSAMRSIRKARVPDMHPFMTQVQRLHKLYHPAGDHAPRQFSMLFK